MNNKNIDCKMKEIYFDIEPVQIENNVKESINKFWFTMDLIGMQNLAMQRVFVR